MENELPLSNSQRPVKPTNVQFSNKDGTGQGALGGGDFTLQTSIFLEKIDGQRVAPEDAFLGFDGPDNRVDHGEDTKDDQRDEADDNQAE